MQKRMKRLGYEATRNETFELILIGKSVGPQESEQRAGMGGGGAGRARAGAPPSDGYVKSI